MRLSRPIRMCATTSIHNRGVSPWLMPRSNRSTLSGTCANKGSSASLRISSRATSASRRSTTTPVRSAASIRALRSASRSRIGLSAGLAAFCASDIGASFGLTVPCVNLAVTNSSAKRLWDQWVRATFCGAAPHPALQERALLVSTPESAAGERRSKSRAQHALGPARLAPDGADCPWTLLAPARPEPIRRQTSGLRRAIGLFHDGVADACLVTALFRDFLPAVLRFLAGLERTFDLGRAFHELMEVHRAELAANNPQKAALGHSFVSCVRVAGQLVADQTRAYQFRR